MDGGDKYKVHRKAVNPLFFPTSLQRCLPILNMKMRDFLERYDTRLDSKAIEFTHPSMDFILDSILATMFGIDHVGENARLKFIHDTEK